MTVVVNGPVYAGDDPAADLRDLVLGLDPLVTLVVSPHDASRPVRGRDRLDALVVAPTASTRVSLHAAQSDHLVRVGDAFLGPDHVANVARTALHDGLSDVCARVLGEFDEVWLATPWEMSVAVARGVDEERLVLVPTPIDLAAVALPLDGPRPFTFLSPFTDAHAAGADLVVEAFAAEFRRRDDVLLHLVLTSSPDRPADEVESQLQGFLDSLSRSRPAMPRVVVSRGLDGWEHLLAGADALVRAPRSSEAGRDLLLAMASGVPVVSTAVGALTDVLDSSRGIVVPAPAVQGAATATGTNAPDVRRLRQAMRALATRGADRDKVTAAREYVAAVHSSSAVAAAAAARLKSLSSGTFCTPAPQERYDARRRVDVSGPVEPFSVGWRGVFWNSSGYAAEARAFVSGLHQRGWDVVARRVSTIERGFRLTVDEATRVPVEQALARRMSAPPTIEVIDCPGEYFRRQFGTGYVIGRTMFETSSLNAKWVERCNAMDEIWVPTAFNEQTFRSAGVTARITKVPLGVDAARFRPGAAALVIPDVSGKVVLAVFVWGRRKGWQTLLRSWYQAFGGSDEATLVLRTHVFDQDPQASRRIIEREIEAFCRAELGVRPKDLGRIVLLPEVIADTDLPRLYAAADALVAPSHGEGWGLPQLEALACGLPVLATRWGGSTEFLNDRNSVPIEIEPDLVPTQERGFLSGQLWCQPDVSSVVEALRKVVDQPQELAALAVQGRRDVEEQWTWQHAVDAAEIRLLEVRTELAARRRPAVQGPRVRWEGRLYQHHSLSHVNRELTSRLVAGRDLDLDLVVVEEPQQGPSQPALAALLPSTIPGAASPAVTVRHQWPPDLSPVDSGKLVLVQPWEYGGLPDSWVDALNDHVDEAWVYTRWLRDCYVRSGVPAEKVHLVPLGVDTEQFRPEGDRFELPTATGCRLLFVGGAIPRKGLDLLLRAYAEEFASGEDVTLVVKAFGGTSVYAGSPLLQAVRDAAASPAGPKVVLIEDDLSPAQLAALYRSCDVLVHPYRGEGFGLTVAEGMASGLPVVTTAYGAALDVCTAEEGLLVPAREVPLPAGHGLPPSRTGYWWAEPDLAALRSALRRLVDAPELRRSLGAAARRAAVARLGWEAPAELVRQRLHVLAAPSTVFVHDFHPGEGSSLEVVASYVASFGAADPTTLVLQAPGLEGPQLDEVLSALEALLAEAVRGEPDVLLLTQRASSDELREAGTSVWQVLAPRAPSDAPVLSDLTTAGWRSAAVLPPLPA